MKISIVQLVALFVVLVVTQPVVAATILDHRVELTLDPEGYTEREQLLVAVEEAGDIEAWSSYSIFVDDHIELEQVKIEILDGSGKVIDRVPRRKLRTETSVGFGLYTSGAAEVADLPMLKVGQRIRIEVTRRHTPIFLSTRVLLLDSSPKEKLHIAVRGGGPGFRFSLRDPAGLVTTEEIIGGVLIAGQELPSRIPPDFAGKGWAVAPALNLAWSTETDWLEVGRWYDRLAATVQRGEMKVTSLADELAAGHDSARAKAAAVIAHVKRKIRYEAVEVGIGGWVPSPAAQVVSRGWGDCKDKSELVRDMLAHLGIEAHLVLIHNGRAGRADAEFPATLYFNHCVVAIKADDVAATDDDPVVDGWLFVDATQDRGTPFWLSPGIQGQWALVTKADGGSLVQLPERFQDEGRILEVAGDLDISGSVKGMAALRYTGNRALPWIRSLDVDAPARLEEDVRVTFQRLLPGVQLGAVSWRKVEADLPTFQLDAAIELTGFARGTRLRPPFLWSLPETRSLAERTEPLVMRIGVHRSRWLLGLPDGVCPPAAISKEVRNPVGAVMLQTDVGDDGQLIIERTVVVERSWIDSESVDHLAELATAERRGNKRSLRLKCPE